MPLFAWTFTVTITSSVHTRRAAVWDCVSTFQGVNYELAPFLYMTCPDPATRLGPQHVTDAPLFRSWLLLFGFIPIEYDLIRLESLEEGASFQESSSMALMSLWSHRRQLREDLSDPSITQVTDTLVFSPRFPLIGYFMQYVVRWLFMHRHRRLAARFGSNVAPKAEFGAPI